MIFMGLMLGSALYWCKENIINNQVSFPITDSWKRTTFQRQPSEIKT